MRRRVPGLLFLVMVFRGVAALAGPEPEIKSWLKPDQVLIGEPFEYRVKVSAPRQTELRLVAAAAVFTPFSLINETRKEWLDKEKRYLEIVWKLAAFEPGKTEVRPPVMEYRGEPGPWHELTGPALSVTVTSALKGGETLAPAKGKWRNPFSGVFYAAAVLAALAALAGLFRLKRGKAARGEPVLAPHELALRELEELRRLDLVRLGRIKEYYEKLSGCLRHYLENRFSLAAPHMSTEEFLEKARTAGELDPDRKRRLREFLELSDLVKFARYGSSVEEAEAAFGRAKNFVEETRPEPPAEKK